MIGILGWKSAIAESFRQITEHWDADGYAECRLGTSLRRCDKLLVCTGMLVGRQAHSLSPLEQADCMRVNFLGVATFCDDVLAANPSARICVIGSESGFSGSFDMAYAGAKAALHLWVETKRLEPSQQLVAIAPGIIADAGMTTRREDVANLERRAASHPKQRLLAAQEVASLAAWLLGPDGSYVSGTVVRMNGGERR